MFNNLIESSSHMSELKRRGSFFLFTVVTYALAFIVAGVASIYAYDARLADPSTEFVTMLSPLDFPHDTPAPPQRPITGASTGSDHSSQYVRRNPMSAVNDPQHVPGSVSAAPNTNPPLPPNVPFTIGDHDLDPASGPGRVGPGGHGNGPGSDVGNIDVGTPPPTPEVVKKPVPRVVSKGVITSEALSLPKPAYPPIAKQMRVQGTVSVQVLIDESGRVVSAKAIGGSPVLMAAAQKAALEARFSPTKLSDQPVKVSGVITYNFVLQ